MAVSRSWHRKAPNQNPVDFVESKQFGGAEGKGAQKVGEKLTSGKMREQIYGRKDLK